MIMLKSVVCFEYCQSILVMTISTQNMYSGSTIDVVNRGQRPSISFKEPWIDKHHANKKGIMDLKK